MLQLGHQPTSAFGSAWIIVDGFANSQPIIEGGWHENLAGGAFGYGLSRNIRQGYKFLVDHHEVGDEIYPGFPILGVLRLRGQPERDDGIILRSCKVSQSPVYPIRVIDEGN